MTGISNKRHFGDMLDSSLKMSRLHAAVKEGGKTTSVLGNAKSARVAISSGLVQKMGSSPAELKVHLQWMKSCPSDCSLLSTC